MVSLKERESGFPDVAPAYWQVKKLRGVGVRSMTPPGVSPFAVTDRVLGEQNGVAPDSGANASAAIRKLGTPAFCKYCVPPAENVPTTGLAAGSDSEKLAQSVPLGQEEPGCVATLMVLAKAFSGGTVMTEDPLPFACNADTDTSPEVGCPAVAEVFTLPMTLVAVAGDPLTASIGTMPSCAPAVTPSVAVAA